MRKSPGGGNGNPLQYSLLKNPMDRGAWGGYSPRGHKESDMTKHTHTHTHTHTRVNMYKERGKIIAPGPRNQNNDGAIDKK